MNKLLMQIEPQIRQFVAEQLLFNGEGYPYADDASFLREGIVDSLGVMELVEFVQSRFGIAVETHDVTPENFDSVSRLSNYVRRKAGGEQEIADSR